LKLNFKKNKPNKKMTLMGWKKERKKEDKQGGNNYEATKDSECDGNFFLQSIQQGNVCLC